MIIFAAPETGTSAAAQPARSSVPRPPIVLLKAEPSAEFSTISVDNRGGAMMATRHLLALGRRRIGHIGGPPTWREARDRADGWRAALAEAGVEPGPMTSGDWSSASGARAFADVLAQAPDLDGVFVANDQMALGLLHVAHARGVPIPDEIAVVGFDGLVEGAEFTPSLTTIGQPLRELGRLAVRELLSSINDEGGPPGVRNVTLATELILRDSAPAADAVYAERVATG